MRRQSAGGRDKKDAAKALVAAMTEGGNTLAADRFLEKIIDNVGGPDAMAKIIAEFVKDKKVAVTARARMMVMVGDYMKYHTEMMEKKKPNIEDLSTQDLEAVLGKLMKKTQEMSEDEWRALGKAKGWAA